MTVLTTRCLYICSLKNILPSMNNPLHLINDFFDEYAAALESFNAKFIMQYYELPCTFISDNNNTVYTDALLLESFLIHGIAFYKIHGIIFSKPEVWTKVMWTDEMTIVKVKWNYSDNNLQPLYSCDYQYLLRWQPDNKWKIAVAISINEQKNLDTWMLHHH